MAGERFGGAAETPGTPLHRTDEGSEYLRRRIERPARIGQYVLAMLGAVTAVAGAALWFTDRSLLGLAFAAFGLVLAALGGVQFLIIRRDREHWPDQVLLWDGGVELILHNGEVRGVGWEDADLALNLVSRRAPAPADREYLLVWMAEGKIPSAEITAEGFDRLQRVAVENHLMVTQPRASRRPDGTKWVEIRASPAGRPVERTAAPGEATAP